MLFKWGVEFELNLPKWGTWLSKDEEFGSSFSVNNLVGPKRFMYKDFMYIYICIRTCICISCMLGLLHGRTMELGIAYGGH